MSRPTLSVPPGQLPPEVLRCLVAVYLGHDCEDADAKRAADAGLICYGWRKHELDGAVVTTHEGDECIAQIRRIGARLDDEAHDLLACIPETASLRSRDLVDHRPALASLRRHGLVVGVGGKRTALGTAVVHLAEVQEHPVIMSGASVRALLEDRKTKTRRVITAGTSLLDGHKPKPWQWRRLDLARAWVDRGPSPAGNRGPYLKVPWTDESGDHGVGRVYPKWQVGDRLWAREAWRAWENEEGLDHLWYRADDARVEIPAAKWAGDFVVGRFERWQSPLFLPRWGSRIKLEVTSAEPQRLWDITEEDAQAEGVELGPVPARINGEAGEVTFFEYRRAFASGWDELNAGRGFPWSDNPWVWVFGLRRLQSRSEPRPNGPREAR